ncbi:MAG: tRNA pseudouridine(55) synthase TruB [Planctomycetes bacterium]|nr:tRNA pseudouridine(55) synthase TruB [Planctomycetota bacterium]
MHAPAGFLLIDKPSGPSSHDVVDAMRAVIGEDRIGHCGTLDPLASGVLILCVGVATRLSEYLLGHDKGYEAQVLLGVTTDTDDVTGDERSRNEVRVDRDHVERALDRFRGTFPQLPPTFSARRYGGKRAYERARAGKEVALEPTPVTIHELRLVAFDPPHVTLELRCSAGTYVRSLARDLGAALGCGGTIEALRRTSVGSFTLAETTPLVELTTNRDLWRARLLGQAEGLRDLEAIHLDAVNSLRVRNGLYVPIGACAATGPVRAVGPDGSLVAILRRAEDPAWLRPSKVFHDDARAGKPPRA